MGNRTTKYRIKSTLINSIGDVNMRHKNLPSILFFLTPAMILLIVFVIYPVIQTLWLSFLSPDGEFVGLRNYLELLKSKEIINSDRFPTMSPPWGALVHNAVWIAIHLPLSVLLGLFFAIILKDVKGAPIVKSMIFLGMVMPMVVGGLMAVFLFDKDIGIVNVILRLMGIHALADISWVAHPETALIATILSGVWMWTGFSMIVYSAALSTIPREYYEAAEIDGASSFQKFIHITLPLLKPATLVVIVMSVLYELKIFDIIYVATLGGPGWASNVLALLMYFKGFVYFKYNQAAALATLLTLLTLPPAIWIAKTAIGRK